MEPLGGGGSCLVGITFRIVTRCFEFLRLWGRRNPLGGLRGWFKVVRDHILTHSLSGSPAQFPMDDRTPGQLLVRGSGPWSAFGMLPDAFLVQAITLPEPRANCGAWAKFDSSPRLNLVIGGGRCGTRRTDLWQAKGLHNSQKPDWLKRNGCGRMIMVLTKSLLRRPIN